MSSRSAVLCFGHDELLLRTRRLILRKSFQVSVATSMEAIAALARLGRMDLVLLCHSLTERERDQVIVLAGDLWPQIKILILTAPDFSRTASLPHEEFAALESPLNLMHKLREMLCDSQIELATPNHPTKVRSDD